MIDPNVFVPKPGGYRKTKIVATLGPSTWDAESIEKLLLAGVNVFRLNFSHGTHEKHGQTLRAIREVAQRISKPVAVLQDLSGPKIRITAVDENAERINDEQGLEIIADDGKVSSGSIIRVQSIDPAAFVKPGNRVLLADGIIELEAIEVKNGVVSCRAIRGGRLRSRVGICFPDSELRLPAATDKDIEDLHWGIENKVDFVAVSFVQEAADIAKIRVIVDQEKSPIKIIPKIEHKTALRNIDQIIEVSDGIMVARGDLGLEVPIETVPIVQRQLVARAERFGVPVIIATQLLHSMVTAVRPTRAEVTDVAAAVFEGADAVMLSEETAIGDNPLESVNYLDTIARTIEGRFKNDEYLQRFSQSDEQSVPNAVAFSACAAATKITASAIVVCTDTGNSARLVAKYRPHQPLFAVSNKPVTLNQMCLLWGVKPICGSEADDRTGEVDEALKAVQLSEGFPNGSKVVVTSGIVPARSDSTSVIEIKEMNVL